MNRGFAFIEFSACSDTMNAYKRLQTQDVVLGTDKTAKVSFVETFIEPDEEVTSWVKTIFFEGCHRSRRFMILAPCWPLFKGSFKRKLNVQSAHNYLDAPNVNKG